MSRKNLKNPLWQKAIDSAGQMFALTVHDRNQAEALDRAISARDSGLDPSLYATPLPGSNSTNITTNNAGGLIRGALLAALAIGSGAAGTLALTNQGPKATQPIATVPTAPTVPTVPIVQPAQAFVEGDEVTREQQADGTWKEVARKRVRIFPDGTKQTRQPDGTWALP